VTLTWRHPFPDSANWLAQGSGGIRYLVVPGTSDGCAWLTRYRTGAAEAGGLGRELDAVLVAAQAARNVFAVHPDGPGRDAAAVARRLAEEFEDGRSLFGRPAWQHER